MEHRRALIAVLLLTSALVIPASSSAAGFEGTVKSRTISVPVGYLSPLLDGQSAEDPEKVMAISPEQALQLNKTGASPVQVTELTTYIKGPKVRADVGSGANQRYMILDIDQNKSWVVTPAKKQYLVWSEADIEALRRKISERTGALERQMAGLPPDHQKRLQEMTKDMAGPKPDTDQGIKVRPTGQSQTINGMKAAGYEVITPDKTSIGWVAQGQSDLVQVFKAAQKSQENMWGLTADTRDTKDARAALTEYGLPVRVQTVGGGKYRIDEVLEVQRKSLPTELFSIPADFQKTEPPAVADSATPPAKK